MALFEKSLNIPAVHEPPSPKSAAAAAGSCGCTPRTIAAVHSMPPPLSAAAQPAPASGAPLHPTAESIESLGAPPPPGPPLRATPAAAAAAAAAATDGSHRRAAAVQHLLSGVRPTATGAPPPPSPLQAAVGGLAELGYAGAAGGMPSAASKAGGSDRESIWQQELSQELYRVKASSAAGNGAGAVPNRRMSMHGSPLKSRLHALHP